MGWGVVYNLPPLVEKGLTYLQRSVLGACTPLTPTSGNPGLKVALKSTCPDFLLLFKVFFESYRAEISVLSPNLSAF